MACCGNQNRQPMQRPGGGPRRLMSGLVQPTITATPVQEEPTPPAESDANASQ